MLATGAQHLRVDPIVGGWLVELDKVIRVVPMSTHRSPGVHHDDGGGLVLARADDLVREGQTHRPRSHLDSIAFPLFVDILVDFDKQTQRQTKTSI